MFNVGEKVQIKDSIKFTFRAIVQRINDKKKHERTSKNVRRRVEDGEKEEGEYTFNVIITIT